MVTATSKHATKITESLIKEIIYTFVDSTPYAMNSKNGERHEKIVKIIEEALAPKTDSVDELKKATVEEYERRYHHMMTVFAPHLHDEEMICLSFINPYAGGTFTNFDMYMGIDFADKGAYKELRDALSRFSNSELLEFYERLHRARHPLWTGIIR
ncbi:MAG: hypothetical protein QXW10_04025 [Candidatus Micrarchaeaceae archaeon]